MQGGTHNISAFVSSSSYLQLFLKGTKTLHMLIAVVLDHKTNCLLCACLKRLAFMSSLWRLFPPLRKKTALNFPLPHSSAAAPTGKDWDFWKHFLFRDIWHHVQHESVKLGMRSRNSKNLLTWNIEISMLNFCCSSASLSVIIGSPMIIHLLFLEAAIFICLYWPWKPMCQSLEFKWGLRSTL